MTSFTLTGHYKNTMYINPSTVNIFPAPSMSLLYFYHLEA